MHARGRRAQDRGVGERVAVDLARQHRRARARPRRRRTPPPAGCSPRRRGACRRRRRPGRSPDFSRGSRSSRKLILSCAPSGLVSGSAGSPSRIRSTHGATLASTNRAPTVCEVLPSCQVTSAPPSSPRIALTPAEVTISAPGLGRGPGQRVGDRAHAADRHPPLAGAVADQVVEEAAVLDQRGVVQRGERADQGVGRDHPADGVVGEAALDGGAERACRRSRARCRGRPGRGSRARWAAGDSSVGATACARSPTSGVELAPRVVLLAAAGQLLERASGRRPLGTLDEQAAGLPVAQHGRVRRRGARRQGDVQAELVDELVRHAARPGRSSARAARAGPGTPSRTPRRRRCGRAARGRGPRAPRGRGTPPRRGRCGRRRPRPRRTAASRAPRAQPSRADVRAASRPAPVGRTTAGPRRRSPRPCCHVLG